MEEKKSFTKSQQLRNSIGGFVEQKPSSVGTGNLMNSVQLNYKQDQMQQQSGKLLTSSFQLPKDKGKRSSVMMEGLGSYKTVEMVKKSVPNIKIPARHSDIATELINSDRKKHQRVKVRDNWLDPEEANLSGRNMKEPPSLLPGKQRFTLHYIKRWKHESMVANKNSNTQQGTIPPLLDKHTRSRTNNMSMLRPQLSDRTYSHKRLRSEKKTTMRSGEFLPSRSIGNDSIRQAGDRPMSKKKFKDDADVACSQAMTLGQLCNSHRRRDSTEESNRSPSLFEELSIGQSLEQAQLEAATTGRSHKKNRSITDLHLKQATNQNATLQENICQMFSGGPELMYQHVQFRRIEKFIKNYIDSGQIMNQKMCPDSDRMLQEIRYMDGTTYRGESFYDDEIHLIYKEGQGQLVRSKGSQNLSYYNEIVGTWSRGILHGKRIEYKMNLEVFPSGYLNAFVASEKPVNTFSVVTEMKRGVLNGPATILINDKKVCKTQFSDQIEFMKSKNHPIGVENNITNDRAVLNCALIFLFLTCIFLSTLSPDYQTFWVTLGIIFYLVQWVEVIQCQTTRLLQVRDAWDDLELFRKWFYELKKCRPVLTFSFTPTMEQQAVLKELYEAETALSQAYLELQAIRKSTLEEGPPGLPLQIPSSFTGTAITRKEEALASGLASGRKTNEYSPLQKSNSPTKQKPNQEAEMKKRKNNKVVPCNETPEGTPSKSMSPNRNSIGSIISGRIPDQPLPVFLDKSGSGVGNNTSQNRRELHESLSQQESLEYINNYPLPTKPVQITTEAPAAQTSTQKALIDDVDDRFPDFKPEDFTTELKYSLWTDLSGEQTEFQDAFEQLNYSQILKVNVFSLFDISTIGHEMVQSQKVNFAKSVISQMDEKKVKIGKNRRELEQVKKIIGAQQGQFGLLSNHAGLQSYILNNQFRQQQSTLRQAGVNVIQIVDENLIVLDDALGLDLFPKSIPPFSLECQDDDNDERAKDLALQTIVNGIKVTQKIDVKKHPSVTERQNSLLKSPLGKYENKRNKVEETPQVEASAELTKLLQSGKGCNMTLFNANVLKEGDQEIEEMVQIGCQFSNNSGVSDNGQSNTDRKMKSTKSQQSSHQQRQVQRIALSSSTNRITSAESRPKPTTPQNTKVESSSEAPVWLNFYFFIFLSAFGLGWILRLIIFQRSVSANIFMRKVILR